MKTINYVILFGASVLLLYGSLSARGDTWASKTPMATPRVAPAAEVIGDKPIDRFYPPSVDC